MLRTALRPRWLALLGLVAVVVACFVLLGLWQLNVARDSGQDDAQEASRTQPAVVVTDVAMPHTLLGGEAVGRTVLAQGTYEPEKEILITGRRLGEATGFWVLTPIRLSSNSALLPVVRGFVTDPSSVPAAPLGQVTVTGMLAPGEGPPDRPTPLPTGQMAKIDLAELVNHWDGDLYSAFVFATAEQPRSSAEITRVPPPSSSSGGLNLRNLAYALQWWLFAAFALYMWWRMVREEHQREALLAAEVPLGHDPDGPDGRDRPDGRDGPATELTMTGERA